MPEYCVNKRQQANGDHEVHEKGCIWWPDPPNVQPLGWHASCALAVLAAKRIYPQSNGCKRCSLSCHTQ